MVYLHFGKFELAEDHLKSALKTRPGFVQAFANLGILFKKTGRLDQAEAALIQALELDPTNADIFNALGEVYLLHPHQDGPKEPQAAHQTTIC